MLSFSYTIDLQLRSVLAEIDQLRTRILIYPLLPKTEQKIAWEAMAIRIWATLALSGHMIPKQEIATILAHPVKPTKSVQTIYALRDAYQEINATHKTTFLLPRELSLYLEAETEHPVIQAAIAHAYFLMQPEQENTGTRARLAHYLLLATYGYHLRGFISPERAWYHDEATYHKLAQGNATASNLNLWLEFIAQSMRDHLYALYEDIQSAHFHIEFPQSFWTLADRQKQIMRLLLPPHARLTNRDVKKRFHISQITASRDLSRLTTLGLIYPHGKGRSVYYTKI